MNLSAKVEYACIALLELAEHWGQAEPLRVRDIADRHKIPSRFLVQILLQLKGAGLVTSTRGATGGYLLARAPDSITLWHVISVMEGSPLTVQSSLSGETPATRVLLDAWNEVSGAERRQLASISFGSLAERLQSQAQTMYYI